MKKCQNYVQGILNSCPTQFLMHDFDVLKKLQQEYKLLLVQIIWPAAWAPTFLAQVSYFGEEQQGVSLTLLVLHTRGPTTSPTAALTFPSWAIGNGLVTLKLCPNWTVIVATKETSFIEHTNGFKRSSQNPGTDNHMGYFYRIFPKNGLNRIDLDLACAQVSGNPLTRKEFWRENLRCL